MGSMIFCTMVTPDLTCRFDSACYGEVCICPRICRKAEQDLTPEDHVEIAEFMRSGVRSPPSGSRGR